MDYLGRPILDGEVRGTHLGKVLTYLKMQDTENLDITYSKLALVLGINPRYIRENYLKGLMYFGVIKLYQKGNSNYWKWIGVIAFNGHTELKEFLTPPIPIIIEKPIKKIEEKKETIIDKLLKKPEEKKKEKKKEVKKEKKFTCKNCGKETEENRIYCNEKCVRDFYSKKVKK